MKENAPSPAPLISAHRGAADLAPENTLPALEKALEIGIPMLELDVRASRDGVLYNLHDPRVDRTTDGRGRLSRMPSARVDALSAKEDRRRKPLPAGVPRTEAILSLLQDRALFYFDVKKGVKLASLLELVRRYGLERKALFWFKDSSQARKLKRLAPELLLKMNAATPREMLARQERYGADVIECSWEDYRPSFAPFCRERGLKLMISFLDREEEFLSRPAYWRGDIISIHRTAPFLPYFQEQPYKGDFTYV